MGENLPYFVWKLHTHVPFSSALSTLKYRKSLLDTSELLSDISFKKHLINNVLEKHEYSVQSANKSVQNASIKPNPMSLFYLKKHKVSWHSKRTVI